ncbi:hypothetical protein [Sphingomonas sanxanigenens]|uniref:Lipoprotein n=1 Tax=Sphingomonas sanxanigenens DSM 19645 = NX02 TaxID=1123269 RepID=W0APF2_9SPHN|nr:hypothetical protein [Sphingomonas sanxanigenens]AHE57495.1 hypothetical protein NX02_29670 [Sphingomonas sanxanigenens DSM 19645 = NX02]
MKSVSPIVLALALGLAGCGGAPATNTADADNAANVADVPEITDVPVEGGGMTNEGDVGLNAAGAALPTDAWVGKWIGVEGLVLDIQPGDGPGKYALAVTLMDGTENYEGTAKGETIAFTRDGKAETIRKATGDETGLKYLAGKTNCLMIKTAEGFCR